MQGFGWMGWGEGRVLGEIGEGDHEVQTFTYK